MKSTQKQIATTRVSFLQLLRVIFVIFSLYLLQNIFSHWDGFSFYASFREFIPAVALVSILWTIVAFLVTILVWILFRLFEEICDRTGLEIRTEHLLLYGFVTILLGLLIWKIKKVFWQDVQTSIELKSVVLACVILVSVYPVWRFRNKVGHLFKVLQERITPLVWLFGFLIVLSVPVVSFYTVNKNSHKPIPQGFLQSNMSKSAERRPNIILIIFDTLAARDMSLYGYQRKTTPFIDRWAMDAIVFTRAEAESNYTTPATASIMTGKRVWTHQVYHQAGSIPIKSDIESLPGELKKHGYYNVAFVVNPFASAKKLGILNSFDIAPLSTEFYKPRDIISLDGYQWGYFEVSLYKVFGDKIRRYDWIIHKKLLGRLKPIISPQFRMINPKYTKTAVPPALAFNRFLEIYDDLPEPFFAWIHVYPPHAYYLPPEPYRGMFGPYLPPERYKELAENIDEKENSEDMRDLRILYDEFIRYCDKQFEEFIVQLEKKERIKNTLIILTSDHGESFQHDVYGHRVPHLYEQLTHIPLIIKKPNQSNGKIIHSLVEQIDIPATILELAGISPPQWMEGRSLVPLIRGEELSPKPAFSMYLEKNRSRGHQITRGTIAVWEGDYKLIHYLEEGKSLLFNLKQDPEELNNLINKEPEIAKHLLELIETNLAKANEKIRLQKGYN
jgi:arylsulfatase A-like enzyme